ncbi:MAG: hypothetical protein ACYCXW_04400 [Solirubrobacteraceae bacterium]
MRDDLDAASLAVGYFSGSPRENGAARRSRRPAATRAVGGFQGTGNGITIEGLTIAHVALGIPGQRQQRRPGGVPP